MDKILPADLSAGISEVEVQQDGCNASHRDQNIAEILIVPRDISLRDILTTYTPQSSCNNENTFFQEDKKHYITEFILKNLDITNNVYHDVNYF